MNRITLHQETFEHMQLKRTGVWSPAPGNIGSNWECHIKPVVPRHFCLVVEIHSLQPFLKTSKIMLLFQKFCISAYPQNFLISGQVGNVFHFCLPSPLPLPALWFPRNPVISLVFSTCPEASQVVLVVKNPKNISCQWRRCKRRGFNPWIRKISWKRAWQPTPVPLPKESHKQRSLVGYGPEENTESDTSEAT